MGLLKDEGSYVFVMNDNRNYTVTNANGSAFSFGENSQNTVTNNFGIDENIQKAFKELNELINKIENATQREQAEMNSELLKEAIENKDNSKSGRVLKFLVGALGVVQPLVTIAQLAGIPIPSVPSP